ncbi:MAG: M56 family metallopeptidase [Acidobacteriota bacterium]
MTALIELLGAATSAAFDCLIRASVQGGAFILLVWLAFRLFPQLPAAVRCTLWWLACLKLLVVLLWFDPLPVPVLDPPPVSVEAMKSGFLPVAPLHTDLVSQWTGESHPEPAAAARSSSLVVAAWATILAVLLAALAARMWRVKGIADRAVAAPPQVQTLAAGLCESLELARQPAMRFSEEVDTPLVVGFCRPVVLLPAASFRALGFDEQRMALCHELAHLRRRDLWLAWVPALAERVFFFHPLAHVAVREYQLTREAACDATVLQTLDACPADYGRLLLTLGLSHLPGHLAAAGSPSSFSKLKRRIRMLRDASDYSPRLRAAGWAAVLVAALAITPLTFVARSQDRDQPARRAAASQPPASAVSATASAEAVPQAAPQRSSGEEDLNCVLLLDGDHTIMSGSSADKDRARSFQKGSEPLLWFRRGGREYVVRDPAVLSQVEEIFRPLRQIGKEQAEIGSKQAEIGSRQAEIGTKQAAIGRKQAEIGARQAEIGSKQAAVAARQAARERPKDERALEVQLQELEQERRRLELELKNLEKQMQELSSQMQDFNRPMENLSKDMRSLSQEMTVLSRKMPEASAKAEAQMSELLDRAISTGAATAVK